MNRRLAIGVSVIILMMIISYSIILTKS